MDGNFHKKGSQQTSIISHLHASIKTEASDDEEENEHDDVTDSQNSAGAFFCEFCDYAHCKSFQSLDGLLTHCLECHPTACLGCFEILASSEDLLEHLQAFPHEPPVCRNCVRLFSSAAEQSIHKCSTASSSSEPPVTRSLIREKAIEGSLRSGALEVKVEPEDEESGEGDDVGEKKKTKKECREEENESVHSSESEDDLVEKYVPEESSEDDSLDEEESEDEHSSNKRLVVNYGPRLCKDVLLSCMHCSFTARGSEMNPSIKLIRNHTYSAHPTTCSFCFESFENEESLNEHQETLKHKVWGCKDCKVMYVRKVTYYNHVTMNHPDQCPFPCPKCPARFLSQKRLKRHQNEHQNGDRHDSLSILPVNICTICDYSTHTTFAIMMHFYEKHPEPNQIPKFKCDECQIGFSRPNYFGRHILEKHAEDQELIKVFRQLVEDYSLSFECEACGKSYSTRSRYIKHLRVIHPYSMPHHCSICSAGYLDPFDLRMHECTMHRGISPYECDHCHKIFKKLSRLTNHFHRVHKMTTMPYVYCFLHNVGFCSNDNASTHQIFMHRVKPKPEPVSFNCEICGKVLKNKFTYANHLARHKSERPFKCSKCDKCYVSLQVLKLHEGVHSTKHQCNVCGKSFHSEPFLKRHAVVHTGEKPFECTICGLKVSQKSALKRHMDKVHPGGIMGKPRSTKSRKCRVLSKALEKQKEDEFAKKTEELPAAVPSAEPRSPQCPEVSKATPERKKPKAPPVKLDTWLLTSDLATKPQPILPPGARRQKRQRKVAPSEEDDSCSTLKKPRASAKGRSSKKRKRKSRLFSDSLNSSDEDEEQFSESDDEDDETYVPKAKTGRSSASRRSSRLKA